MRGKYLFLFNILNITSYCHAFHWGSGCCSNLTTERYVFILYYYFCNSIMKCLSMISFFFLTSFRLLGLKFMVTSGKGSGIVSSRMASISLFPSLLGLQLDACKDYPLSFSYLQIFLLQSSLFLLPLLLASCHSSFMSNLLLNLFQ